MRVASRVLSPIFSLGALFENWLFHVPVVSCLHIGRQRVKAKERVSQLVSFRTPRRPARLWVCTHLVAAVPGAGLLSPVGMYVSSESQGTATRVREDPELSICSSCLPPALQDPCCSVLDTSGLLQNDGRSWGVVLQRPQSLLGAGSPVGNGSPSLTGEQQQLGSPCGSPRSLTPVGRSICQEGERGSGGNAMASLANTAHGELRVPAEFKSEEESYQRSAAYPGGVQGNMPRVSLSVRGARRQEKGAQELKGVVVSSLQEFSQLGEEGLDRYRKPTSVAESAGLCAYAQDRVPAVLASAGTQEDCVRVFDTRGPAASEHDQRTRSPREGGGEEDSDGEKLFEEGRRPAQKTNECILRLSGLRDGLGNYGKMKLPADDEARLAHAVAVDFEGGRRRPGRRPLSGVDGGAVFLMIALAIHGLFEGRKTRPCCNGLAYTGARGARPRQFTGTKANA